MNNDLIERYIYAVTRRLPSKLRSEVGEELRGLIDDMLADRCGELTPQDKDVRVVLTELGTPAEVAEKYTADSPKCLIGAPYYYTYTTVLKIVLCCVAFGIILASVIELLFGNNSVQWYSFLGTLALNLFSALCACFTFITLLFAVFYRKGIDLGRDNSLEDLPSVPNKKEKIGRASSAALIVFIILVALAFTIFPNIFVVFVNGEMLPIFNAEVMRSCWYILLIFAALGIIRECVKLIEDRYNFRVMVVCIVTNLLSIAMCFWWLLRDNLINPIFQSSILDIFPSDKEIVINMFSNFQYFLLFVITMALIIDTAEAVYRYFKYKNTCYSYK